jgi:hypothetical protein
MAQDKYNDKYPPKPAHRHCKCKAATVHALLPNPAPRQRAACLEKDIDSQRIEEKTQRISGKLAEGEVQLAQDRRPLQEAH